MDNNYQHTAGILVFLIQLFVAFIIFAYRYEREEGQSTLGRYIARAEQWLGQAATRGFLWFGLGTLTIILILLVIEHLS